MRKLLRHNVFKGIIQVGFDRVIRIETNKYYIYFEFYSTGNIIITNFENSILELYRPVKEMGIEKNLTYVVNYVELLFNVEVLYKVGLKDMLGVDRVILDDVRADLCEELGAVDCYLKQNEKGMEVVYLHGEQMVCEDVMKNEAISNVFDGYFKRLILNFEEISKYGALMYLKNKPNNYIPYKLKHNDSFKPFNTFNDALQSYYFKEEIKEVKKSNVVEERQQKRILNLEDSLRDYDKKIELMYKHKEEIEKILKAHMNVIAFNLDWDTFNFYKEQQTDLSNFIDRSDFSKRNVFIKLKYSDDLDFILKLDFMKSFNVNVNLVYDERKRMCDKLEKTKSNIQKVVLMLAKKENSKKKKIVKEKINRKILWFEKFNYCFTSNNKLIISGKNAQQNDILVKKHLENGDLYFHADIHGASSVILKNGLKYKDEKCIEETGYLALCMSSAWKNKVTSNVFYVNSEQVTKMANTGEYLKTGSFMIRGKKNYVDVHKLELGICIVFKNRIDLENMDEMNVENAFMFKFIANPSETDDIEFGLVVISPWAIIKNYKYKERILPGNEKKSNLVNKIIQNFAKILSTVTNEKEINAVKNITVMEYMNVVISNSKIGKQ